MCSQYSNDCVYNIPQRLYPNFWNSFKNVLIKFRGSNWLTDPRQELSLTWNNFRVTPFGQFSHHFYSNYHNSACKCVILEYRGTEFSIGKTSEDKNRNTASLYSSLRSLNWARYPAMHPAKGGLGWAHHASFTYVLTATTSPIMHFCGKKDRVRSVRREMQLKKMVRVNSWPACFEFGEGFMSQL